MKIYYADHFVLPLPAGHRFPMAKYARLRARVAAELVPPHQLLVPAAASDEQLVRAHRAGYVQRVRAGELTASEIRRIGFPWSDAMVERSRRSVGATVAAAYAALDDGAAVNLAGGTHHASADRGEGFCVFNDVAVAALELLAHGRARRIAVIDTDVHQGNGTAAILGDNPHVFTFSVHGARNYPFQKSTSTLDIALDDGAADDEYLAAIDAGTSAALQSAPDLVFYLAGADPWEGDRLGRLAVTRAALAERDHRVLGSCAARGIPVAVAMAGGYAPDVDDIVAIHFHTVATAALYTERAVRTSR